ncbi:MAG: hypothetical protein IPK82_34565 [Polyangiaceae bacterium]|nr:hypothetical protein [Polyangiaceae bacterium]
MTSLVEGALVFEFSEGWLIEKYDEHAIYRGGVERLKDRLVVEVDGRSHVLRAGTKAVDFIGLWRGEIHFIEVKDFRGHRIENKKRLRDGELAIEVAVKVRDTIAGLVGGFQRTGAPEWRPFVEALARHGRPHVCLWLEEDTLGRAPMELGHPGLSLEKELDKQLSWLAPRLLVQNRRQTARLSGISVRSLPDGIVELRARMRRNGWISMADYCSAFGLSSQATGTHLKELCARKILVETSAPAAAYHAGPQWLEWLIPP